MSDFAWVAWYWGDYIGKTTSLSLVEHGIYVLLLANYYITGGPLPADKGRLARMCGVHSGHEYKALNDVLTQFFVLNETNVYRHKRADEEIAKRLEISGKRRDAANKRYASAPAIAQQVDTQSQSQSQKDNTKGAEQRALELPDWIPVPQWEAYLKMRRDIRKPASPHAQALAIKKLEQLRKQGHSPDAVLDQSTFNCWQGLFELGARGKPVPTTVSLSDDFMAMRRKYEKDLPQ